MWTDTRNQKDVGYLPKLHAQGCWADVARPTIDLARGARHAMRSFV
jgi:hypothetical protein